MFKLIHYPLCPLSRSIRLALGECGLIVELEEERPWAWRRAFLNINPAGALPVLLSPDGPVLCGAYAISEFLAETRQNSGDSVSLVELFPGTSAERAETRRLVDWFLRKFDDEVTRYLLEEKVYQRFSDTGRANPDPATIRAGRENLRYHLNYMTYLVDERRWMSGDRLSFADFAAAGQLSTLDYMGETPWDDFPLVRDWYARVKSRPSFRSLLADRIPGLLPPRFYSDLDF
jgi:glutathione S-transferase